MTTMTNHDKRILISAAFGNGLKALDWLVRVATGLAEQRKKRE